MSGDNPRRGITSDLLWTAAASLVVLVANATLASMLARRGAADVFEPYNLAKRVGAALLPFVTVGLTVGLVKHIAATAEGRLKSAYTVAAFAVVAAAMTVVSVAFFIAPELSAKLLTGGTDIGLLWAVWAYAVALAANALVYAFYRAEIRQGRANVTNVLSMAVIPLAVIALAPQDWTATPLLLLVSGLIILWNAVQLGARGIGVLRLRPSFPVVVSGSKEMLAYSTPRIPAGLAMGFLLALGPIVARWNGEARVSAYVLAGLAVAQIATASLQAFGIVLLPRVTELDAAGDRESVADMTNRLLFGALALAAVATPFAVALAADVVPVWLGPEFQPATRAVQVIALSIPGVVAYNVLRSVADGVIRPPVNTYAALAGLLVAALLMLSLPLSSPEFYGGAYALGQTLAAGVVMVAIIRVLRLRLHWVYLVGVATAATLASLPFALAPLSEPIQVGVETLVAVLVAASVLLLALWFSPPSYAYRSTMKRIVGRVRS